jgi:hypothetical protein
MPTRSALAVSVSGSATTRNMFQASSPEPGRRISAALFTETPRPRQDKVGLPRKGVFVRPYLKPPPQVRTGLSLSIRLVFGIVMEGRAGFVLLGATGLVSGSCAPQGMQ